MRHKHSMIFVLTFFFICAAYAQVKKNMIIEVGLLARATAFHYVGADKLSSGRVINADAPYLFSRGVDGVGLNIALGYQLPYELSVRTASTIRYAFYYFDNNKCWDCVERTLYIDQSFSLAKSKLFNTPWYVAGGASMINMGKELRYQSGGNSKILPLHFTSLDVAVGRPVWQLGIEARFSYVDHGFPGRVRTNAEIIGLRVYYSLSKKRAQ